VSAQKASGTLGALAIFGVPVRFHFTFLLLAILLAVAGFAGQQRGLFAALYFGIMFTCIVAHEFGHVLVARRYGIETHEIVLYPIGGVARLAQSPRPRQELWIALAGPLVNVAVWGAIAAFFHVAARSGPITNIVDLSTARLIDRIGWSNLYLAAFNMLPAFPMDGGRVLRSLLARWKSETEATRIATLIGRGLALLMGLAGLVTGMYLLVFIAFFVYTGATQEGIVSQSLTLSHGWPVRAAMVTDYRTLTHGNTVREAGDMLLATSQQDFPVVHGDKVVGLLDRVSLLKALADGPEVYVAGVMRRDFLALKPEMDLAEALPLMAESGAAALVLEGERLVGILTKENLTEFLVMRRIGVDPSERSA
jgi:Zn-dependent protease